jgi:hypothetical protein
MRKRGMIERIGPGSLLIWDAPPFKFSLVTPFSGSPDRPILRSHQEAVQMQYEAKPLPYRLNVWRGARVMFVEWAEDGPFAILSFKPGNWENEVLALT